MSGVSGFGESEKANGTEATVDINDRKGGESLTRLIVQVAAVSCTAAHVPEHKLAIHLVGATHSSAL